MNKNLQEPIEKLSARRRLVRGVFAAPAALSLYSGSALAATSHSCVAKDVGTLQIPANSGLADTWLRVRLYNMTNDTDPNKVISWINGADLAALNPPSSYLFNTQWQCYAISSNITNITRLTVGQIFSNTPSRNGWTLTQPATGAYVAVRVDSDGNIMSVGEAGTSGYGVHGTCWASFRPGP